MTFGDGGGDRYRSKLGDLSLQAVSGLLGKDCSIANVYDYKWETGNRVRFIMNVYLELL